jgi:Ala-tRNA(Pro) deacylase
MSDVYSHLLNLLSAHKISYRLIDHPPEGQTEIVSQMRGHSLKEAAKCIVIMVKVGRKETRYVLGVVPGDARVNLDSVKKLFRGTYVAFASPQIAESLAGSGTGSILPFSFHDRLELIVDPSLLHNRELYFNMGRLDRSIALTTKDYLALANPRVETIAQV